MGGGSEGEVGGSLGVGSVGAGVVGVGSGPEDEGGGSLGVPGSVGSVGRGSPGFGPGPCPGPERLGAVPYPSIEMRPPAGEIATRALQYPDGSRRESTYTLIVNDSPGASVPAD